MNALQELLQASSNAAASGVSAPVDGLAWLMRKAGIPVGQAPVGGSAWMSSVGLTKPVSPGMQAVAAQNALRILERNGVPLP